MGLCMTLEVGRLPWSTQVDPKCLAYVLTIERQREV
jgi:hypothetical protein